MTPGVLVLRDFLLEQGCSPARLFDARHVWQTAAWTPAAWPLAHKIWLETPSTQIRTAHAEGLAVAFQLQIPPSMVETSQRHMTGHRCLIGGHFDLGRNSRLWLAAGFEVHAVSRVLKNYAIITSLFLGHVDSSIEAPDGWSIHTNAHRERYLVKWWP